MAVLRTLLRVLLVLSLWIGVSGAASVPATLVTAPSTPEADQSDLHARLLDLLGGVLICGDEDSAEDDVLCGGDLLAGLVTDPSMLLMSRGTCSRLLEQLYSRQVCDPARDDCGQMQHGGLPAPRPVQVPPTPSSGLLARHNAALLPLLARARTLRARDDPDPASQSDRPVPPPPRAALA